MAESGRSRLPAKKVTGKLVRGFKSHSLRYLSKGRKMTDNSIITNEYLESLFTNSDKKHGNYSTIWLHDVDVNSDEVIGLELVNGILCITVSKFKETATDRTYEVLSQFAVDKEAFQSALDCLDIIDG